MEDLLGVKGIHEYPLPANGKSIGGECSVVCGLLVEPCGKKVQVGMTPLNMDFTTPTTLVNSLGAVLIPKGSVLNW